MSIGLAGTVEVHRFITEGQEVHAFTILRTRGFVVTPEMSFDRNAPWTARDWKRRVKRHLHDFAHPDYRNLRFFNLREPSSPLLIAVKPGKSVDGGLVEHIQQALTQLSYHSDEWVAGLAPWQSNGLWQLRLT